MYPLNDKDLDRLSRDAAEHYDVESSTSGWERLENRLDKELPVKEKNRRRFLFWLLFIALVSGGSLVFLARINTNIGNTRIDTNKGTNEATNEVANTTSGKNETVDNKATGSKENVPSNNNTTTAPDKDGGVNDHQAANAADEKTGVAKKNAPATKAADDVADDPLTRKPKGPNQTATFKKQQGNDNGLVAVNKSKDRARKPFNDDSRNMPTKLGQQSNNSLAQNDDQNKPDRLNASLPSLDANLYDRTIGNAVVNRDNLNSTVLNSIPPVKAAPPVSVPRFSRWEFGITTGPDFSNVEFKHNYKTGFNIGAYVGYRISNRWLINTGFIYTKKFYKVAGEDFTAPKHSVISYKDVKLVTGSCNMFEIPVNVRYDFSFNQKRRWFASAGISSYVMDKQAYVCDYLEAGQMYAYPWSENKNYDYFISNINLSIGYERALGKRFSIQAEPYFKIPVQGLGYGSIKMNSYGALFTFKYKP
jgi:hypothetical protein